MKTKAQKLALLGIFSGIIILQNLIPILGYLPIPPLNPTYVHVTVIVASIVLGVREGVIVGGVWGVTRWFFAIVRPQTPLDPIIWTNPVIAILPRILLGLIAGSLYLLLLKRTNLKINTRIGTTAALATLSHTIMVLSLIYLFHGQNYLDYLNLGDSNFIYVLATILVTNGLAESIIAVFLGTALSKPLLKRVNKL